MTPVLVLHGALGSSSQLKNIKEALENEGFVVYTLDFSGHSGKRYREGFGIETFSLDVLDFLRDNELTQVDIFGYSMGGYVAVWFAFQNPQMVRRIITLGTKFDWSVESSRIEVQKLDPIKIKEKVPAFARLLEQRHSPNDWVQLVNKTSAMMLGLGESPLITESELEKTEHNILIMLGDRDDMADREFSKHCAAQLPNGEFILLRDTPHPIEKIDLKILANAASLFFRR